MGSEVRKNERQAIYSSKEWKSLRKWKIQYHPLCEDCLDKGIITAATEVHHIKSPFQKGISEEEKIKRAYDADNLVSLCRDCHIRRHHQDEELMKDKLLKYSD